MEAKPSRRWIGVLVVVLIIVVVAAALILVRPAEAPTPALETEQVPGSVPLTITAPPLSVPTTTPPSEGTAYPAPLPTATSLTPYP